MRYQVIEGFRVKTSKGEMELQAGQIITLPYDKAIRLLSECKITPVEKVAYRVWSEILQAYLLVVDTDQDIPSLRSQGISEAIYTHHEIKELKKLSKEDLREIQKIKETFSESTVEEVKNGKQN